MKRFVIPVLLVVAVGVGLALRSSSDEEQAPIEAPVDLGDGQWKELADADAAKAYQTILKMVADPDHAVPYLRERLLKMPMPTRQEVTALIGDLDSNSFAKRTAASRALEKMGPAAELVLIGHLDEKNPPELQQRIKQILQKLETRRATAVEIRVGRALEVLERIASNEAKHALKDVAKERADNWVGDDARKGIARLQGHAEFRKMRPEEKAPDAIGDSIPHGSRQYPYRFAAISPDSKKALVTVEFDRVFLWDLLTGTVIRELPSNMACGAVAWAPNGKVAASGRYTGEIDLWDTENWELLRTLPGHPRSKPGAYGVEVGVFHLQFSADSQQLISAGGAPTYPRSMAGSLCHWVVATGELLRRFPFPEGIAWADNVSPDGELITYRRPRPRIGRLQEPPDVVVWNLAKEKQVIVFDNTIGMKTFTFTSTGRYFLAGHNRGSKLCELASLRPDLRWDDQAALSLAERSHWVTNVAISPSDQKALTVALGENHQDTMNLWDLANGKIISEIAPIGACEFLLFSRDDRLALALGDKNYLALWDLATGKRNRTLVGPYADERNIKEIILPNGNKLWSSGNGGLLDIAPDRYKFFSESIFEPFAMSADGKWLFTSGIALWDTDAGKKVWTAIPDGEKNGAAEPLWRHSHCAAISPDGSLALSGGSPTARPLSLWDLKKGTLVAELAGHKGHIRSVAFSHDGELVVSRGDDKTVKLWEVRNGKLLKSFDDPGGPFSQVAFSPDDKLLWSRGARMTAWEVSTGKLVQSTERPAKNVRHFAYSADGTLGLSGIFDDAVTLWDMKTGKVLLMLEPPKGVTTPVDLIDFVAEGKLATVVADNYRTHVWDIKTGKLIRSSRD